MTKLDAGDELLGPLLELERAVQDLLAYVPATFPHYTRHTLAHSIEIVEQIGKLLLTPQNRWARGAELNATEIYTLAGAALLHDAGMVTPDSEQERLLQTSQWDEWVTRHAAGRYAEIQAVMAGAEADTAAGFAASVDLRRLIAEYIRRIHHERSKDLVLGDVPVPDFWLGDVRLRKAVANICLAHGLDRVDLTDEQRFPWNTEILGQPVDVRFLAILVRLGDLLDLSHDRACPVTAWAAGDLPEESHAHWEQFDAIEHRATTKDAIEITARCAHESGYRVLRDWCNWICQETDGARALMARSPRHGDWNAPVATLGVPDATIRVDPTPDADFVPSDWRVVVEPDLIVKRFTNNVHADRFEGALFELVQNAIDATRCRAMAEHHDQGLPPMPPYQLPRDVRAGYPITVTLSEEEWKDAAGSAQTDTYLTIDDRGLGMSPNEITDYLLQVGKSYYRTEQFSRDHSFTPASQFGVGFLTVFGVSTHVELETRKAGADEAVGMTLTRPNDYVLRTPNGRTEPGTRIRIKLDRPVRPGTLNAFAGRLGFVEFPVKLIDHGTTVSLFDEVRSASYPSLAELTLSTSQPRLFGIRVDKPEVSGWILMQAHRRGSTVRLGAPEDWQSKRNRVSARVPFDAYLDGEERYMRADAEALPARYVALGGMQNGSLSKKDPARSSFYALLLDIRPSRPLDELTLDRQVGGNADSYVRGHVDDILEEFFAGYLREQPSIVTAPRLLGARRRLVQRYGSVPSVRQLKVAPVQQGKRSRLISVAELHAAPMTVPLHRAVVTGDLDRLIRQLGLTSVYSLDYRFQSAGASPLAEFGYPPPSTSGESLVSLTTLMQRGELRVPQRQRRVAAIRRLTDEWWEATYILDNGRPEHSVAGTPRPHGLELRGAPVDQVGVVVPIITGSGVHFEPAWETPSMVYGSWLALNLGNPLGGWLFDATRAGQLWEGGKPGAVARWLNVSVYRSGGSSKAPAALNVALQKIRENPRLSPVDGPPPDLELAWTSKRGLYAKPLRKA